MSVSKLYYFIILFLTLFSTATYAGPNNYPDNIEQSQYPALTDDITLPFKLKYKPSNEYNILNHITFGTPKVPGFVYIEYIGIHNIIFSQARQRIKLQAQNDLRREWNLSSMSDSEFRYRMDNINTEPPGPYGYWWERPWNYSLPPEKGGAPLKPEIMQIGWELNMPKGFTPYWWIKSQIDRIGDIWLSSDIESPEETGSDPQRRDGEVQNDREGHGKLQRPLPELRVAREYRWFESGFYHLRFKPSMRFRPDENLESMIDEISMRMQIELYVSNKKIHFGNINFFAKYNISDNEAFLDAQFEIITW
jgi:hypothetical protein